MTQEVMPSMVQMEAADLQKLVAEVKETVATFIQLPDGKKKTFGELDMWNIRRNFRSARDIMNRR